MVSTRRTKRTSPAKRTSPVQAFPDIQHNLNKAKYTKDHKQRAKKILNMLASRDSPACVNGWQLKRLLGVGTVGTVFMSCQSASKCAAMKIQVLKDADDLQSFTDELAKQTLFGKHAPQIYSSCIAEQKGTRYGIIVMEQLGMELDKYLASEVLSDAEIRKVGDGITTILKYCKKENITHGDLALFNIAFNSKGKLVFLDFDRAYRGFVPKVDFWRLFIELFPETQSSPTQKLHNEALFANCERLRASLPDWAKALGLTRGVNYKLAPTKADELWVDTYQDYCKRAKVKCLE